MENLKISQESQETYGEYGKKEIQLEVVLSQIETQVQYSESSSFPKE